MKTILKEFRKYFLNDFHFGYYFFTLVFVGIFVYINYAFDFENAYIEKYNQPNNWTRVGLYFALYAFVLLATILIRFLFRLNVDYFISKSFFFYSSIGIFIVALDAGFPYSHIFTKPYSQGIYYAFAHYIVVNGYCIITTFLPLLFIHFILSNNSTLFGLKIEKKSFFIYILMLLFMTPLVYWAALQPDFLNHYPKFIRTNIAENHPMRLWLISIFEFFYTLDFVSTELIFRGFLVIFLSNYAKEHIVLPVAVVYCALHFGKPAAETISSLFGGYILGMFAFQTKNIWGGIFVHVGIALMMEVFAFLLK